MTGADPLARLCVVGPGRLGLAICLALRRSGRVASLLVAGRAMEPPAHPLFAGPDAPAYLPVEFLAQADPTAILLAVPDAAIAPLATVLAQLALTPVPVLHTSGALAAAALSPLARARFPTGSLHPLVAVADPEAGADRLVGGWYGMEGSPEALDFAEQVVEAVGGRALRVGGEGKALYHAAAVFASNYVVALLAVAERLMESAGVAPEAAREALAELAAGAARNVSERGPADGLTGPISRGDAATIAGHLARLSPGDRLLYSVLAREALVLARRARLDPDLAAEVARVLDEGTA